MDPVAQRLYFEFQQTAGHGIDQFSLQTRLPDLNKRQIRCALARLLRDEHIRKVEARNVMETKLEEYYYDAHACEMCGACCKAWVVVRLEEWDTIPEKYTKKQRGKPIKGSTRRMRTHNGYCICHNPDTHECALFETDAMPWHCRNFAPGVHNRQCVHFRRLMTVPGGCNSNQKAAKALSARRKRTRAVEKKAAVDGPLLRKALLLEEGT